MERLYSIIEREVLGILHGFIMFPHYCFEKEVYVITNHKLLVAMITKDLVILSQWLQHIMLQIHWYSMYILYKPGPELYTVDWLSHHKLVEN